MDDADRAGDARLSRTVVVETARAIVVEQGLEALSLRRVAGRLGVTAPALYTYVASKEDLLRAVADGEMRRLAATFDAPEETDPVQRMRLLARAYIDHARAHPQLFRTLFLFPPRLSALPTSAEELPAATSTFEAAAAVATRAEAEGRLAPDVDAGTAALVLWTAAHGAATVLQMGFELDRRAEDDLVDAVLDAVLRGLTP